MTTMQQGKRAICLSVSLGGRTLLCNAFERLVRVAGAGERFNSRYGTKCESRQSRTATIKEEKKNDGAYGF
jgi:hypothetical protein